MDNKEKNQWTLKKKMLLYRLVEDIGPKWSEIASILKTTPSIARGRYRHTNWKNLFKDNKISKEKIHNDKEINDYIEKTTKTISAEQEVEELIDSEKQKIILIHEKRKSQEIIKQIAAEQLVLEKLISSVVSAPPIDIKKIILPENNELKTRPEEAVLLLSDLHLGLAVKPEEVGGVSKYNKEIFEERLDSLISKIIKITSRHRKHCEINKLNVFMLGDNVHGSNNAGQWGFLNTELTIVDQLFELWTELEKGLLKLKAFFPEMSIHCVCGNHGRTSKRGFEKHFVNWDFLLYHMLQKTLKNQKGISWSIPRSPFDIAEVQGHKFLLIHGDQINSFQGIPFYGMVRAESKYRALLDRKLSLEEIKKQAIEDGIEKLDFDGQMKYVFDKVKNIKYLAMGHFHHMAELETSSGGRLIMNSSFAGGDDYSINSLLTANTPAQKFFGVHPEGKSWTYDVELERQ